MSHTEEIRVIAQRSLILIFPFYWGTRSGWHERLSREKPFKRSSQEEVADLWRHIRWI